MHIIKPALTAEKQASMWEGEPTLDWVSHKSLWKGHLNWDMQFGDCKQRTGRKIIQTEGTVRAKV